MRTSKKEGNSSARSDTSADEDFLDQYEVTAKYYDIWYEDFTEDVEFLKRMAERTGGPILDCMCGTGRTLLPLAKEGYEISGWRKSCLSKDRVLRAPGTSGRAMTMPGPCNGSLTNFARSGGMKPLMSWIKPSIRMRRIF